MYNAYFASLFIGLLLSVGAVFWFPGTEKFFVEEGGLFENLTALAYFLSAFFASMSMPMVKGKKFIPGAVAAISMLFFLDEISWGKDIIGYDPPVLFSVRIDSVHDLLDVLKEVVKVYLDRATIALITLLILIAVFALAYRSRKFIFRYIPSRVLFFVTAAVGLLGLASLVDTHFIYSKTLEFNLVVFEEYFEFSASATLFFLSVSMLRDVLPRRKYDEADTL